MTPLTHRCACCHIDLPFDPAGNTTKIIAGVQTRTFVFDGLGRKTSETTPRQSSTTSKSLRAFHSFRRFRTAHVRKNRVPWDLQKLWLGHANKDVTDRYAEQLKEGRKEVAESAGLGLKLPNVESSVGLLGLPKAAKNRS